MIVLAPMYKRLVIPTVDFASAQSALAVALPLAKKINASIQVFFLSVVPSEVPSLITADPLDLKRHFDKVDLEIDRARREEAEVRKRVAEILNNKDSSISATWDSVKVSHTEILAYKCCAYDLVVCGAAAKTNSKIMNEVASGVLKHTGRPAILVPNGKKPFDLQSVTVIWDRTRQTSRAIQLALPLLKRAKYVSVFSLRGANWSEIDEQSIIDFLRFHDVNLTTNEVVSRDATQNLYDAVWQLAPHSDLFIHGQKYTHLGSQILKRIFRCDERSSTAVFTSS